MLLRESLLPQLEHNTAIAGCRTHRPRGGTPRERFQGIPRKPIQFFACSASRSVSRIRPSWWGSGLKALPATHRRRVRIAVTVVSPKGTPSSAERSDTRQIETWLRKFRWASDRPRNATRRTCCCSLRSLAFCRRACRAHVFGA